MTEAEQWAHRQIVRAVFWQLLIELLNEQAAARAAAQPHDYGWFDEWLSEERDRQNT